MSRRKVSTTVYLEQAQLEALAELSKRRRVPMAALIRGSIDELLTRDEAGRRLAAPLTTRPELAGCPPVQVAGAGAPLTLEAGALGGGTQ